MIEKGIAVIGSTTIDKIVKNDSKGYFKLGGVTTYSGITYSRHDMVSHIVTNVAPNDSLILDILVKENINVHNGVTDETTCFENYIKADNRSQCIPSTARPITNDQISEVMDLVAGVHLGPLHPQDIEMAVLTSLKESIPAVYLDIQGYVRYIRHKTVFPTVSQYLTDALAGAQIVKANEQELNIILCDYQMDLNSLMTKYNIEEFIVSQGAKGGYVKSINTEEIGYKAVPVRVPDDTTGAGDVFFAAYIISRFLEHKDIRTACNYAAGLSARQVEGKYITKAQLNLHHL